ncbi:hypothetical protein LXA43DRAFT_1064234 [Ganoderma leucocontextum]|nr:hypothetical protein LXA43DRAFT_1064234 [Ganoderma leucocontextum]
MPQPPLPPIGLQRLISTHNLSGIMAEPSDSVIPECFAFANPLQSAWIARPPSTSGEYHAWVVPFAKDLSTFVKLFNKIPQTGQPIPTPNILLALLEELDLSREEGRSFNPENIDPAIPSKARGRLVSDEEFEFVYDGEGWWGKHARPEAHREPQDGPAPGDKRPNKRAGRSAAEGAPKSSPSGETDRALSPPVKRRKTASGEEATLENGTEDVPAEDVADQPTADVRQLRRRHPSIVATQDSALSMPANVSASPAPSSSHTASRALPQSSASLPSPASTKNETSSRAAIAAKLLIDEWDVRQNAVSEWWFPVPQACKECEGRGSRCRINLAQGTACNTCTKNQRSCSLSPPNSNYSQQCERTWVLLDWLRHPANKHPKDLPKKSLKVPKWFVKAFEDARVRYRELRKEVEIAITARDPQVVKGSSGGRHRPYVPQSEDESDGHGLISATDAQDVVVTPIVSSSTERSKVKERARAPTQQADDIPATPRPVKRTRDVEQEEAQGDAGAGSSAPLPSKRPRGKAGSVAQNRQQDPVPYTMPRVRFQVPVEMYDDGDNTGNKQPSKTQAKGKARAHAQQPTTAGIGDLCAEPGPSHVGGGSTPASGQRRGRAASQASGSSDRPDVESEGKQVGQLSTSERAKTHLTPPARDVPSKPAPSMPSQATYGPMVVKPLNNPADVPTVESMVFARGLVFMPPGKETQTRTLPPDAQSKTLITPDLIDGPPDDIRMRRLNYNRPIDSTTLRGVEDSVALPDPAALPDLATGPSKSSTLGAVPSISTRTRAASASPGLSSSTTDRNGPSGNWLGDHHLRVSMQKPEVWEIPHSQSYVGLVDIVNHNFTSLSYEAHLMWKAIMHVGNVGAADSNRATVLEGWARGFERRIKEFESDWDDWEKRIRETFDAVQGNSDQLSSEWADWAKDAQGLLNDIQDRNMSLSHKVEKKSRKIDKLQASLKAMERRIYILEHGCAPSRGDDEDSSGEESGRASCDDDAGAGLDRKTKTGGGAGKDKEGGAAKKRARTTGSKLRKHAADDSIDDARDETGDRAHDQLTRDQGSLATAVDNLRNDTEVDSGDQLRAQPEERQAEGRAVKSWDERRATGRAGLGNMVDDDQSATPASSPAQHLTRTCFADGA